MNKERDTQESAHAPDMTEQERLSYAAQLRGARVKARLTQAEVAEQAGIATNTYASMENGSRVPQAEKLWAAMLVLGLQPHSEDPEWLLEWWAVMRPLIMNLPRETRGVVMWKVVQILGDAVANGGLPESTLRSVPQQDDYDPAALNPGYSPDDENYGD
ncbi:helix-turn-helix transcriptional regulator [Actinomycetaceae bacterium L2_0104]